MSGIKWTPGPWALDGTGWICDANGSPVCLINAGLDDHELEPQERADAHLIAAAPDLYEALKRMKTWCEDEVGAELPCDSIDASLAKARGEV